MGAVRFDGIIFDAGDILYDASVWRRWLTGQLQALGADLSYEQLVEAWESLLVDVYCGRADYWDRFRELLEGLGVAGKPADELTVAARAKGQDVQVGRKPFDGVPETLEKLKTAGVKLAVLSDTESGQEKVRATLRELGIDRYFDVVVTSRDIGHVKPSAAAFEAAMEAIGVHVERCAFVGHDADELDGAREAKLFAVAYNHRPGVDGDVCIEDFRDLWNIVAVAE